MAESLFSPYWYRVALLRPRLRAHVRVQRQKYRDQLWYLLVDEGSGRWHRLNEAAYRFIGRCDGRRTVREVWETVMEAHGDAAPSQGEVIRLLGQLNEAELLQCELTPDVEALFRGREERLRRRRRTAINPLAFRVPLFDPSHWLKLSDPWLPVLFRPAALLVWFAVVVPALLVAAQSWPELHAFAVTHMATPRYLVIAWLCYPLIKALHELGHALAVRRWGGEIHELSLTLFVLLPAPYIDASAASGFRHRHQRVLVSAMGIMVEMLLAAVALFVWANVQTGLVRDIAFVVMVIGGVSTLFFNGNPLLRFDAYYVLCDLLDLPNLAPRSQAWWHKQFQRRVFRITSVESPPLAAGERKWLLLYAPLSLAYRVYVGFLIVLWVGAKSTLLGFTAAALMLFAFFLKPLATTARQIVRAAQTGVERRHVRLALVGFAAAVAVSVICVPVPFRTLAPAVVWLPDQAQLRAETEGFVSELRIRDGEIVRPGQVVAVLDDPQLFASRAEAASRLEALRVEQYHTLLSEPLQTQNIREAIAHAKAELARVEERIAQLEIRSQIGGRLVLPHQEDLPGTFMRKGERFGYVLPADAITVRVAVPHEDAALVRSRTRAVGVSLEDRAGAAVQGELRRDVPAATHTLPSPALSDRYGGTLVTDPADTEAVRTLQPVFLFDVALPATALERVGGRVWVRFDHGWEALAIQWGRQLRQLLLQHFNPTA